MLVVRQRKMRRFLLALCLVVALFGAYVAGSMSRKFGNMGSEYATAEVIRKVREFVEAHDGAWPRSWADLGMADSGLTRVDFSLDVASCDGLDFSKSINTRSGCWYTYPDYSELMAQLWDSIKAHRKPVDGALPQ